MHWAGLRDLLQNTAEEAMSEFSSEEQVAELNNNDLK